MKHNMDEVTTYRERMIRGRLNMHVSVADCFMCKKKIITKHRIFFWKEGMWVVYASSGSSLWDLPITDVGFFFDG
jgi:hypothetical protein